MRVVMVTGASSGIGRASALRLAEAGDHLVLSARSEDSLVDVAAACEAAGAASVVVEPLDVGDDDAVARCVDEVVRRHGRIDGVVHAAGVVAYGRTEDVPDDVFEKVVHTNLLGSVSVARHVLPVLREQGRGTLVLVGSLLGQVAVPGMTPYVVSKWGVHALVRQLQLENRDHPHVHVCEVVPGGVDTPIYDNAANFSDRDGRPPFPVSAEKVADVIARQLDRPRRETQVGPLNRLITLGFSLTPRVYDVLVGPLFKLSASEDAGGDTRAERGNVA